MSRFNHHPTGIPTRIPFADLVTPHLELQEELLAVFRAALRTGTFVGGSMVEDFEREFARYCGTRHCVGVNSGTDALRLALIAAGVRPGDVVLTVPNTFIATAEAISQAGARPDFIDVDERTYSMDWKKLEAHLETRCYADVETGKLLDKKSQRPVTAIVPVHLYGQTADMDTILAIAERYRLIVVEDACQAHGAEYFSNTENRWKKAGSMGRAAAFSFYPGANLGACGQAGAVTTDDGELAQEVRLLREHGQTRPYYHDREGYNSRLDAIQAGILQVKLRHLPDWNKKRREDAFCYHGLFTSVFDNIIIPSEPSWARATYHLYVIRADNRDNLQAYLLAANIPTNIHYPVPLHRQKAYRALRYKLGDFPVTEKITSEILSLPIYPQIEFDQQYRVAQKVWEFVAQARANKSRPRLLSVSPAQATGGIKAASRASNSS
jgi:dTDP-4-amino-4,6-dideoxygalactose transaminase